ncbi:MAG TPA: hypothetical protein VF993_14545 [Myxococcales bacterium]
MTSWIIARATARERGLAPLALTITAALALFASLSRAADAWAGLTFEVLTLLLGAGLLADEVESGHAQLVLLRPLTRAQWVGGRLLGAAMVICGAAVLATVFGALGAFTRAGWSEMPQRLAVLPLALLPAFAWLATLVAVGASARGWSNAAWVIAIWIGWKILKYAGPIALRRPDLQTIVDAIDGYFGPQELLSVPADASRVERAAWDLFWLFAAWTLAVRLFNLRELARRRA